ncbi:MAG: dienelactone hydrolase family protein [Fimbriimonas sp.]
MKRALLALFLATTALASAEIKTQRLEYRHGDTVLEGYVAWDDAKTGKRPAVMVVHDWNGIDAYEEGRARQLAELGYVGFAADIYGKGVRPKNPQESGAQAGKYRQDLPLFRGRLQAALTAMKAFAQTDAAKTAAMGYCFGGGGVLELGRSGADVDGIISFHGAIGPTKPEDGKNIKGKVLVVHAAQDPAVPRTALSAFLDEMRDAKVDYQLVVYNLDVHAFTAPGASYNPDADRRSWAELRRFLTELFGA